MGPSQFINIICELFCTKNFFSVVPADFPNRRQLALKTANLLEFVGRRPSHETYIFGTGPTKKAIKARGKYDAEIGKRLRELRSLFEKSRREWLRNSGTIDGKPYTRHAFGAWNEGFKKIIETSTQNMRKQVIESSRKALKH
jgi:hypothetical protein